MKPRTKLQLEVSNLSKSLPVLTNEQKEWALKMCLDHVGYRNKSGISCLDCGCKFVGPRKGKTAVCPDCNTRLSIQDTLKQKLDQTHRIMAILDVVSGFQVIRYYEINSNHRVGCAPDQNVREVVQKWFIPNGKLTVIAKSIPYGSNTFSGTMEIRANLSTYYSSNKYNLFADKIFPNYNVLPVYKRNGFTAKASYTYPYELLNTLVSSPKAETLIKAGQYQLLSAYIAGNDNKIYRYWDSIKICIRNKYVVKEAGNYLDYLELLDGLNMDLRSPKYVCPKNLRIEHNKCVAKRIVIDRREREARDFRETEKRKAEAIESERVLLEDKACFSGFTIEHGKFTIKHLDTVEDFIKEGEAHGHCVNTNKYYGKPNTVCFSAIYEGMPMETVEISITDFTIIQSRGAGNEPSEYNDQILDLVRNHIIFELMKIVSRRNRVPKKEAA